jgi:succinate dehydrogenase/fumarate reductase iron-sulfur protein
MTIEILRSPQNSYQSYTLPNRKRTLLQALQEIKASQDPTLTFMAGCRASVCGTCAVRVNGKERLSCAYSVQEGDRIEPLNYHRVLRDLKVDRSNTRTTLQRAKAWLHAPQEAPLTSQDEALSEKQSDCILCSACYSACPVFAVNEAFLGPFALTRSYRYTSDRRETEKKGVIDAIQEHGVWDCTLCSECTLACPKGIDPKMDIMMLRGLSLEEGYSDPSFAMPNFGTPDFGGGVGFDPNGGF